MKQINLVLTVSVSVDVPEGVDFNDITIENLTLSNGVKVTHITTDDIKEDIFDETL